MLNGLRIFVRDKTAFRMEEGVFRQAGKPMDILNKLPADVKILHIVDLNAKDGNATNLDLYDHMTYKVNIEVETGGSEELVRKLLLMKARAVLDLPCALDLRKFAESRLLVGKIRDGKVEQGERFFDYYLESDDVKTVKALVKMGKRVFLHSERMPAGEAEKMRVFALIRDY